MDMRVGWAVPTMSSRDRTVVGTAHPTVLLRLGCLGLFFLDGFYDEGAGD